VENGEEKAKEGEGKKKKFNKYDRSQKPKTQNKTNGQARFRSPPSSLFLQINGLRYHAIAKRQGA
jgi:hypothetical protein